ncbi:RnfH family protein [Thiomicrorhabdus sp. ZW0627]|uniref:RnfH family protein n=1 Tax=Thiomicrorhabdus sp. ZW0627 TaxID=3039774 RepID=UPI0024373129|nr:RnfH family protein [Thiomicrorhabdus sp. ZW0627]MDG6772719.1 RnfH family protein [Thiomicrorhabdus sp. ZW0627]
MRIEVAYALPEEQYLFEQQVEEGCTVEQALKASKLLQEFPDLNIEKVGIFGRQVPLETVLREGDRIEVYRPLKVDPRDRRRQQVENERRQKKED